MPKRTASCTEFTRRAPVAVVGATRLAACRALLPGLLALAASGCGSDGVLMPAPLSPTLPTQPPSASVTLEGRVLDERDQPVAGGRVTHPFNMSGPAMTTADDTGRFSLTVDWPAGAPFVTLRAERDGYESTDVSLERADAARSVLITMDRSLTIAPGESIHTTVSRPSGDNCWWEPYCRRVRVTSPPGTLADVEAVAADGQDYAGIAVGDERFWKHNFPGRVTVSGGAEIWITVRQPGRVTLRAAAR